MIWPITNTAKSSLEINVFTLRDQTYSLFVSTDQYPESKAPSTRIRLRFVNA